MLQRIAVIADETLAEALRQAPAAQSFEIVELPAGDSLPAGTIAAAGGAAAAPAIVAAAATQARQQDALLHLLADAVDTREDVPLGASERLRQHAERFGQALGLTAHEQLLLERAALLRGVGKLRVSNDIILKKSVLDYDEWTTLKQYPETGAQILEGLQLYPECANVVRFHHECWDGTGYPFAMEGEDIPQLARVLRLLDVYCAMTSPRNYRDGFASKEAACQHLRDERGKHFDPALVDVFLASDIGCDYQV